MKKKLMSVGAGPFQKKGIETARKMGLYVIATDMDPKAAGFSSADKSYTVDVRDAEKNLKIAKAEKINGVIAIASDVSVMTVATVNKALGLAGINPDVAERCIDKELMRKAFVAGGVPAPKFFGIHNLEELMEKSKLVKFPVVVKPADSAGSRGVQKVERPEDLPRAYEKAIGYSHKKKLVLEEFMEGVEVSVEAMVVGGKIHIMALSDKIRTEPPYLLDIQITFPSAYPKKVQEKIIYVAKRAIKAVGVTTGPIHMELMMTPNGPVPVELAARGPGFKIFSDIIPMVTGIDVMKAAIDLVMGNRPKLRHTRKKSSTIKFLSAIAGTVKSIKGVEEIRKMKGIYEIEMYVKPGDKTKALTSGSERIGHIISFASTRKESVNVINKAVKKLNVEIIPD
ncbi:MAG: ATP-grasp domain-containing protein [Candidatus Zambryskibacteria bacterium]